MEWVETTGRTVEEAKDLALDQLGVDEADAEFEVLSEPKRGLFGIVRGEARIRARVRPTIPRPKDDRRRRQRERGRRGRDDAGTGRDRDRPGGAAGATATGTASRSPHGVATIADEQQPGAAEGNDVAEERVAETSAAEQAEQAGAFVRGLLAAFGVVAEVRAVAVDDDTVEVAVSGDDLGLLIGPKGQTLQALQELTRTAVQRRVPGRVARLHVDVAGYREKRRAALERFTRQVAEQVLATGERRVLEPMSPADRKVVHDTVNTIEGVTTTSEGEEPRRRVVVFPAP